MSFARDREIAGVPIVDKAATMACLKMQSRIINPDTGKRVSYAELGKTFGYRPRVVARKLTKELGVYRQPIPQVRHGELPENERAFFLGLRFGDFQVGKAHFGKKGFVVFGTESKQVQKRQLLAQTIGTWGEVRGEDKAGIMNIYLDEDMFSFMAEPIINSSFLKTKTKFAPFLFALTEARLSKRLSRLSLNDGDLLGRIHRQFEGHFGFNMGSFQIESRSADIRSGRLKRGELIITVVEVKDPERVKTALKQEKSVRSLPFFSRLTDLSSAITETSSLLLGELPLIRGWNPRLQGISNPVSS